jgi:hypothetical protein
VDSVFAYDLAQLCVHSTMAFSASGRNVEFGVNMVTCTYLHEAREELLTLAVNDRATHLLWVDSDMRFPKDGMLRLMSHNKAIVGCNYSTRMAPPGYVGIKEIFGAKVETKIESTGLEQVEALGFGFMLFDLRRFAHKLPDLQPLFGFKWLEDLEAWMGEDVFFFEKMKTADVDVWCDHDLSKEIAHVGDMEYQTLGVEQWENLE